MLLFFFQVRSGYLQVDNCIMEDGMVYVQNPGSIAMRFCTLRHATIILQHPNASIIQNCEFSQTDSAAITVEGYPKEDKNWTYRGLSTKINNLCSLQKKPEPPKSGEHFILKSAFSLSTATTSHQKSRVKQHFHRQISGDTEFAMRKMSHDFDLQSHDHDGHMVQDSNIPQLAAFNNAINLRRQSHTESYFSSRSRNDGSDTDNDIEMVPNHQSGKKRTGTSKLTNKKATPSSGASGTKSDLKHHKEKIKRIESFVTDCAMYGNPGTSGESTIEDHDDLDLSKLEHLGHRKVSIASTVETNTTKTNKQTYNSEESDNESDINVNGHNANIPPLDLHSVASTGNQGNHGNEAEGSGNEEANRVHRSLSSSEVSLHTASSNDVTSDEEEGGGYNSGIVS